MPWNFDGSANGWLEISLGSPTTKLNIHNTAFTIAVLVKFNAFATAADVPWAQSHGTTMDTGFVISNVGFWMAQDQGGTVKYWGGLSGLSTGKWYVLTVSAQAYSTGNELMLLAAADCADSSVSLLEGSWATLAAAGAVPANQTATRNCFGAISHFVSVGTSPAVCDIAAVAVWTSKALPYAAYSGTTLGNYDTNWLQRLSTSFHQWRTHGPDGLWLLNHDAISGLCVRDDTGSGAAETGKGTGATISTASGPIGYGISPGLSRTSGIVVPPPPDVPTQILGGKAPVLRPDYDHLADLRIGPTGDTLRSIREIRRSTEETARQLVEV